MAYKTALFSRKTPGGVWSVEDQTMSTGDRYFVGSTVSAASDATTSGRVVSSAVGASAPWVWQKSARS